MYRKGLEGLFIEKFNYVKNCFKKTKNFLKTLGLTYKKATIKEGNVLNLKSAGLESGKKYWFMAGYKGTVDDIDFTSPVSKFIQ